MKKLILLFATFICIVHTTNSQVIARWNFNGESNQATSAPDGYDANLVTTSNSLTRGSGAAASAGANSFRTVGFQNNGIATTNTDYFQFTLQAVTGYTLSLSTINGKMAGTASFCVSPGVSQQFAYSLDGTTFTLISAPVAYIGTPATMAAVDLSLVSALQNVPASTTVTIRFYASGQTTTGGWGFISASAANTDDGLSIVGSLNSVSGNSSSSNIIHNSTFTPQANIDYKNFLGTDATMANSVELGQFIIQDGGGAADADALGTTLTGITFSIPNGSNIERLAIYDGTTEIAEVSGVTAFLFSGLTGLTAPDNGSKTFSLRATFKTTVTDNHQIVATVISTNTDPAGSSFAAANAGGATSNSTGDNNRIEVIADRLAFVQNTTSPTNPNVAMTPAPTVTANDVNGNRDLDFIGNIDVTSTGTLSASPQTSTALAGLASFTTITHTATGTGIALTATSTGLTNTTSALFDIGLATQPTDYFRSKANSNWNLLITWESSADSITWINATALPTVASKSVTILHQVTIDAAVTIDQLYIKSGAFLFNNISTAGIPLTINNGTGTDFVIENGGTYLVFSTQTFTSQFVMSGGATAEVQSGGKISISLNGGSTTNYATSTSFFYQTDAVFEWNTTSTPGITGVTFFPNADATTIPIFRFTQCPTGNMGGGTATIINGLLETNATNTAAFSGNSVKTFRNGIIGTGNITISTGTNKPIINGATAKLGGSGTVSVISAPNTFEIGSATGTEVAMVGDKTISNIIEFSGAGSSHITLGNFNLIATDGFTGQTNSRYVVTNGSGKVKINNIGTSAKVFPVGPTSAIYTPATLSNTASGTVDNYSVLATTAVIPCLSPAQIINSVQVYWDISEDVAGGSDAIIALDFTNAPLGTGFVPGVSVVGHCSGTSVDYSGGSTTGTVATTNYINNFSPFFITSDPIVLPVEFEHFKAQQIDNIVTLTWKTKNDINSTKYTLEKSVNGQLFTTVKELNNNPFGTYQTTDNNTSTAYYRIKAVMSNGSILYSITLKVQPSTKSFYVQSVISNNNTISTIIASTKNTRGALILVNANGQIIAKKDIQITNGTQIQELKVITLPKGVYYLHIESTETKFNKKIIIN